MRTHRERRRVRRLCSLALLFCVCTAASARAAGEYRTSEVESLKITFDSEWAIRTAPGYLPVRFDITNLGEARVIEIVGQGQRYSSTSRAMWQAGYAVRQAVRLARGDRVRLTLPVPIFAESENVRFEIQEDGRTLERYNFSGFQSGSRPDDASALIVADPASAFGKAAASWPRTVSPMGRSFIIASPTLGGATRSVVGAGRASTLDFVLEPSRLPANWLGYTSLRAVVIGPKEWEQLSDAQKAALLTWTACGGDLILVDGDFGTLFPARQAAAPATADAGIRAYFLGRVHRPTAESIAATGLASALDATKRAADANWALPVNRASDWGVMAARGFRLAIPGVGGVPARAYLSILIVFSLLIGPANYWFLRRKRRQVLMVLTAPAISAIFILLLAGYVLAGEGLGVRGRAVSFTMLDQVRQQAVTRSSISLYAAGMTPAGGLHFARDVAVFPIGIDGTGVADQMNLDLTDAQSFARGVIHARSPGNLEQIASRSARERLTFSREAGGLSVVNGLGVPVVTLLYREGNDVYRLTGTLAPGARGTLQPGTVHPGDIVPSLPQSPRFEYLFAHPPDGSYLAVLATSPFWDPGVKNVEERSSMHVLIGWPGGQP